MKLLFEPFLLFLRDAIEAVCGLFCGQEICCTEFTVTFNGKDDQQTSFQYEQNKLSIGNRLKLLNDETLCNMRERCS